MNGKQRTIQIDVTQISLRRQIVFSVILSISVLLGLELAIRVASFVIYDRSPFFLLYGFESFMGDENRGGHSVAGKGYFKFEANHTLHQYGLFKQPTPIRINNIGVRGADVSPVKPRGGLRVVCLGGSSTFGFYARDQYTYPAILEKFLNERLGNRFRTIDVINAGIPHANSDNIHAFLKEELLSYAPDVITIYTGFNDASYVMDASKVQNFLRWMHGHFTVYVVMKKAIALLGGPELYSKWAKYASAPTPKYVERQIELHVHRYRQNIAGILQMGRASGASVILIKQGIDPINNEKQTRKSSLTYEEEAEEVRQKLISGGALSADEVTLLIHFSLMKELESIAKEYQAPVVDNIELLDQHPEYYASYVHLTEDGNAVLAKAIADTIDSIISKAAMASNNG